ncbi:MAG: MBL fold metallo-hydrolase [Oscillospiraceae bacterium]|nr:MBL fold metallo-hydrolase [Oscillospiraceae bacterium]MCD7852839.1 MBL fold metallo-hydrolase [Oscillospiraceae bacterium]
MELFKRPEPITDFAVHELDDGIFNITAPPMHFQQYLVLGLTRAMLIDTGFGVLSLKRIVDGLTDLPVVLVNTHGHPDHVGGNAEFDRPYLHPLDNALYAHASTYEERMEEARGWKFWQGALELQPTPDAPLPLEDGQVFDLGGRMLTAILTPGHTQGSICLLDAQTGVLFSGDTVQRTPTALMEPCATDVSVYLRSLEALAELPVRRICPGHFHDNVPVEMISMKLECCKRILSGQPGTPIRTRTGSGLEMVFQDAVIDYREDNAK